MRVVLKIGGSLLYDEKGNVIQEVIRKYSEAIRTLVTSGDKFMIVVGGGKPAREFISAARALGASEAQCDWIGIKLARMNAELVSAALGDLAYPRIVETLDELETAFVTGRVVLMGGLVPGQSTNAVAAVAAEILNADVLLNATNVDGVYDKDPKESGAKKLDTLTIQELKKILAGGGTRAGEYKLFDPVALRIVERSKIKTIIFNGNQPENVQYILEGKKIGSVITHVKE
jgi:uridylate kinase